MGWGNKRYPVFTQLNILTVRSNADDTATFFQGQYPSPGDYSLGKLCHDWRGTMHGVSPPWEDDSDNPWNRQDAEDWLAHCQALPKNMRADLEKWIVEAIQNHQQIVYKFKPNKQWTATRSQTGTGANLIWHIVVKGPGF